MAAKAAMDRPVAEKATADHPAMDPAKDDAAPVNAGAVKTAPDAERAPHEPAKTTAEAALAYAAAESRMSFVYGLISEARKGAMQLSLWLAASMIAGALAASLAALEGGVYRDERWYEQGWKRTATF